MLHEDVISSKLVDELEKLRYSWKIEPQNTQTFIDSSERPDFIVKEKHRQTVVAEVKIDRRYAPDFSVEDQTRKHIGKRLVSHEDVTTAIAIRLPFRFRVLSNRKMAGELQQANDLHHVLFTKNTGDRVQRFPNEGWITGRLIDIGTSLRIGGIPTSKVEGAASDLQRGIDEAAQRLESSIEDHPEMAWQIESILYQESCVQTSRMAMLIITNAFVFQSRLARTTGLQDVPALNQLVANQRRLNIPEILEAWHRIRDVNYIPIFSVATNLVEAIASDDEVAGRLLWILRNTAQKIIESGLSVVHELAGIVFQRLIIDRDFIKTFYTRPESVALLSALVLPQKDTIDAAEKEALANLKIADYACGTGALLNGVYQRVLAQYEEAGGNAKEIHKNMVEKNLIGYDIMPNASHLTAALITSNFPDIRIGHTCIHVLEYAKRLPTGQRALGSLDLIEHPGYLPLDDIINPTQVQGGADTQENNTQQNEIKHGEMDIVIQNPPFTRVGAENSASNPEVPTTIFGEQDPEIAHEMKQALASIENTPGNSNAGLSSYFVDLANRMLKENGVMGVVLPIIALTSPSWEKVRAIWTRNYHNVVIVTIAAEKIKDCAFSADTNMAECLVVATKGISDNTGRGTFICLSRRPKSQLESLEIAKSIGNLKNIKRLEDPLIGGNYIKVGDKQMGTALNCPLQIEWGVSRVKSQFLVQCAYHLANGYIWLPQQDERFQIPMSTVGSMATILSYDQRRDSKGPFDIEEGASEDNLYPGLWHVKSEEQRTLLVKPDCHGTIKRDRWDDAQRVLKKISRIHHNVALHFNVNSFAVFFTEKKTIGVNLLPNVTFENELYDYAWTLWGNSTLGILCYWMHGSKRQEGRGWIRLKALRTLPTLDLTQLDQSILENTKNIFEELKLQRMQPIYQMFEDPIREELDRRLLSEVLGLTEDTHPQIHQGIDILRKQLSKEPSIHGGKQSRVEL